MNQPSLPSRFIERLQQILSQAHYEEFLRYSCLPQMVTFRVNTLKATTINIYETLTQLSFSLTPISWCPEAFTIPFDQKRRLTETDCFLDGKIYIQNPSSLFAAVILQPQPGEEILDLAAAPGGKTLHLAAMMQNKGRIAAIEPVKERFFRLKNNIANANATIVATYCKDGSLLWRVVPERFDHVLLDAPCSTEARIKADDPKSYEFWSEKKILEMSRKQKKLIYSAVRCLKPNGNLVYSTCSYAPEENEAIIQYALDKFSGELIVEPFTIPFNNYQPGLSSWQGKHFSAELAHSIRIIPTESMAGFYVCKLKKC